MNRNILDPWHLNSRKEVQDSIKKKISQKRNEAKKSFDSLLPPRETPEPSSPRNTPIEKLKPELEEKRKRRKERQKGGGIHY